MDIDGKVNDEDRAVDLEWPPSAAPHSFRRAKHCSGPAGESRAAGGHRPVQSNATDGRTKESRLGDHSSSDLGLAATVGSGAAEAIPSKRGVGLGGTAALSTDRRRRWENCSGHKTLLWLTG